MATAQRGSGAREAAHDRVACRLRHQHVVIRQRRRHAGVQPAADPVEGALAQTNPHLGRADLIGEENCPGPDRSARCATRDHAPERTPESPPCRPFVGHQATVRRCGCSPVAAALTRAYAEHARNAAVQPGAGPHDRGCEQRQ
jgi:hypothetical protein